MNADVRQLVVNEVTSRVIECAYRVSNSMGAGFLEKVYENALAVELRHAGVAFTQQPPFLVRYRQEVVGEYIPDFVVADAIVVEIKALDALNRIHHAQCLNYLRATGLNVGLVLNFGTPRLEIKRLVWRF
jgi:GxxExxY protein